MPRCRGQHEPVSASSQAGRPADRPLASSARLSHRSAFAGRLPRVCLRRARNSGAMRDGSGAADVLVCGRPGVRTYQCVDVLVCGRTSVWTYWCADGCVEQHQRPGNTTLLSGATEEWERTGDAHAASLPGGAGYGTGRIYQATRTQGWSMAVIFANCRVASYCKAKPRCFRLPSPSELPVQHWERDRQAMRFHEDCQYLSNRKFCCC